LNPGSNLLRQALRLIKPTDITIETFKARTLNRARQWVSEYNPPLTIKASVQAVPRNKYIEYGLEFQKNYIKIYAMSNLVNIHRDSSGDKFTYKGRHYQLEGQNAWFDMDGWVSCIAVEVPLDS